MTNDPTDWHQTLARVSGQLVHGEQRVTTRELLTVRAAPGDDRGGESEIGRGGAV